MTSVLSLNAGSSTLKFCAYRFGADGEAELKKGVLDAVDVAPEVVLERVLAEVRGRAGEPTVVGHRLVHGGAELVEPTRVDVALLAKLERLAPLAPLHLPPALELLRAAQSLLPRATHVACFDTAFHAGLPEVARRLPLSDALYRRGLRRFGFHGLSYEYVVSALGSPPPERLIVAHLGSGCSMAAIRAGRCVDTTMGFTPTGGLPMGTRSGDLDPGALLYLAREEGYTPAALETLVSHDSGLKGIAGSADVRVLSARLAEGDALARAALELFAYALKKQVGAYVAALGGVDCLVFTGGIGEHAPLVRELALSDLSSLGIELDPRRNAVNASVISLDGTSVVVRVVPTNEDLVIARAAFRVAGRP